LSGSLRFEQASVRYAGKAAIESVTLEFWPHRVTGLVGPNGAGKTTLLRGAIGLVRLSSGQVFLRDRALAEWSRTDLARAVAYLPQADVAPWPIAARHLVTLGRSPYSGEPVGETIAAVDSALRRADAQSFGDRALDTLSSGEKARVLLARALATGAEVLLADEPAAHLDPAHQLHLMALLRDEAARGVAVVVTLHDLSLAARFCDRIVVLDRGRVVASGEPQDALSDSVLRSVFGVAAWSADAYPSDAPPILPWRRI
jgi:iron complex transport system ATP-binding protein